MKSDPVRPVIAVAGPPGGGLSTVAAVLADALPDHRIVEWTDLQRGDTPAVVVLVVTAAAPMTPSQVDLLRSVPGVAGRVPVVAAVSRIDLHRGWADVLEVNRTMWSDVRVATAWVGVAADPDIGEPHISDLIDAIGNCRIDCAPPVIAPPGPGDRRAEVIARRGELAQARLRHSGTIRTGCTELRAELHRHAARLNRRGLRAFREQTIARIVAAVVEWDRAMGAEFDAIIRGGGLDAPAPPAEPVPAIAAGALQSADPTEVRLTVLIGAVFGAGAALTTSRLLAGVLEGWASAAGTAVGVALALWVIGSRRLLSERAATLRWTTDVLAGARQTLEERVASRALAAEVAMGLAAAGRR